MIYSSYKMLWNLALNDLRSMPFSDHYIQFTWCSFHNFFFSYYWWNPVQSIAKKTTFFFLLISTGYELLPNVVINRQKRCLVPCQLPIFCSNVAVPYDLVFSSFYDFAFMILNASQSLPFYYSFALLFQ